jgi:hypothetical protein
MEPKHLTVYDLLAMPEKERQQAVGAAFAASANEDFEVFEANEFYEENNMTTTKRDITPHKGGRTANIHAQVEPWVKEWIQAQGLSVGDWMTKRAEAERDAQNVTRGENPVILEGKETGEYYG